MAQVLNNEQFEMDETLGIVEHESYDTLKIVQHLGELEREVGLLQFMFNMFDEVQFIHVNTTYGAYIPIKLLSSTKNIYLTHYNDNIINNCKKYDIDNNIKHFVNILHNHVVIKYEKEYYPIYDEAIIITYNKQNINYPCFTLTNSLIHIYVPPTILTAFAKHFQCMLEDSVLNYQNLIHLCMIVKNAGDGFGDILKNNLPYVDQWTILDTGSTDNTVNVIRDTMSRSGKLYEEPFINFRDSRNRCLELAKQHNYCKYFLMLDDTYVLKGNVREFLNLIRGDQFADSYNVFIKTNGTLYGSNRLIKANKNLNYIYKIHEIIEHNVVVQIPHQEMYIEDISCPYMQKRTMDRKQYDLTLLYEQYEEDPNDPRTLLYLTQTYVELEEWDKALHFANLRIDCPRHGYDEEITECYLIIANITQHIDKKDFNTCKKVYKDCYKHDILKPDALYCLTRLCLDNQDQEGAFKYIKKAFGLGYPIHIGANVRDYLYNESIPYETASLCYRYEEYELGLKAADKYLLHQNNDTITSYKNIFNLLVHNTPGKNRRKYNNILCFVASGGFKEWNGSTIYKEGIGGSETYIIEMARNIAFISDYKVFVFCHTTCSVIVDNVKYKNINKYIPFLNHNHITTCFISRYSEFIPVTLKNNVDNVYLVVHDLLPSGNIIPIHDKLKGIFCMSEWHKEYFCSIYPTLPNVMIFPNGINVSDFVIKPKVANSFIYSSFPNRGLLVLLKMFPKIRSLLPNAILNIFCDMNNDYCTLVAKDEMMEIKKLLEEQKEYVTNYGFVTKKVLYNFMLQSEYWLYPCTFEETFCITALEAQMAGCICITNDLGNLKDINHGIVVKGDATTLEWQDSVLDIIINMDKKINSMEFASQYDWAILAQRMMDYIGYPKKNVLDDLIYCDMYNWTSDVPKGSKEIFLDVLDHFVGNVCKILEIGTYAGTSIINMLHYLPDATATVIDLWEDYDESPLSQGMNYIKNVFDNNIIIGEVSDRVAVIVGDSKDVLIDLLKKGVQYDFIYVDGSHHCLDCYSDMIISWNLLSIGGIMGIDDYLWQSQIPNTMLDYPYYAVEFFMKRYSRNIKVINVGYRVFLQKIE